LYALTRKEGEEGPRRGKKGGNQPTTTNIEEGKEDRDRMRGKRGKGGTVFSREKSRSCLITFAGEGRVSFAEEKEIGFFTVLAGKGGGVRLRRGEERTHGKEEGKETTY